eukprot:103923_1
MFYIHHPCKCKNLSRISTCIFIKMAALQIALVKAKNKDPQDANINKKVKPIPRKDIHQFTLEQVTNVELIDKGSYMEIPSKLNRKDNPHVISCLCISDTHGQHKGIEELFKELPTADILIHSGDFTKLGHWGDIKSYDGWVKQQLDNKKFKHCILIGGNHDITLHSEYYIKSGYNRFHAGNPQKEDLLKYKDKCTKRAMKHSLYLKDSMIDLFGVKFYGSPWVPWFHNWAFMLKRGDELKDKWKNIPKEVDVLITHGPPIYHGDLSLSDDAFNEELKTNCSGDVALMKRIVETKPQFHVFGHNHEGYGVTRNHGMRTHFINASTLNRDYKVANKPIMFYVQGKNINQQSNI